MNIQNELHMFLKVYKINLNVSTGTNQTCILFKFGEWMLFHYQKCVKWTWKHENTRHGSYVYIKKM